MRKLFLSLSFLATGVFAQVTSADSSQATSAEPIPAATADSSQVATTDSLQATTADSSQAIAAEPVPEIIPVPTPPQGPLNLDALTKKDANTETYKQRLSLIKDSIADYTTQRSSVQSSVISQLPRQEPKGEFEKQADYEVRTEKWNKEVYKRTEAETKSISARLTELEKAKSKIEENLASAYGSLVINSQPEGASVQINFKAAGTTPFESKKIDAGSVSITVTKDGYQPYQTILQLAAGSKLKVNAELEEKSIFSEADEIDFLKILAKDTDFNGYQSRIQTVNNRKKQVASEYNFMINQAQNAPLKPKDDFEKQADFEKRQKNYEKDKKANAENIKAKYDVYVNKLNRTIEVLNDYIVTEFAEIKTEAVPNATIELGAYDADKESFELKVQDRSNPNLPFEFQGKVGISIDTAKAMNRSIEGFAATVSYLNYPFRQANLSLKELNLTRKTVPLKVEGSFVELNDFVSQAGYAEWKAHTDSILTGKIKPKGLTAAYAMDSKASKASSGDGLGWRGWTRIIAFTAGVGLGAVAVINHLDANKKIDDYNNYKKDNRQPNPNDPNNPANTWSEEQKESYTAWYNKIKSYEEDINDSETNRNIFGAISGASFAVGIITFAF